MPSVSVVVPNYNHSRFLRQRIDTIVAQSYQDFELILMDDCSTDDSRAVLEQYTTDPRVRLEFNDVNSGSTFKQWNKGVRLARGKYVWLAESDDYSYAGFLGRMVALLEADHKTTIAYCRSWRVMDDRVDGFADPLMQPEDLPRWSADYCADGVEECRRYFLFGNAVRNASSALFRKAAYEEAGGADESLRMCGDWKLWASIALRGRLAYASEPMNYYRFHGGSVWGKNRDAALELEEVLRVVRWLVQEAKPAPADLERCCKKLSVGWVMILMSLRVPLGRKKAILRDVMAIDRHPMRRVLRPALTTVGMKIGRHKRELEMMLAPSRNSPWP